MAAVPHPTPSVAVALRPGTVHRGDLSDAQIETVLLAAQAHALHLRHRVQIREDWENTRLVTSAQAPDSATERAEQTAARTTSGEWEPGAVRLRAGFLLGDGTGCGKGRQMSAIILERWLAGERRALWVSQSARLLDDARRDWSALGGRREDVCPLAAVAQGTPVPFGEGILFTTYATLRSPRRAGKAPRLEQVVEWLAGGLDIAKRRAFDGVIIFDECDALANATGEAKSRGPVKPSQQGVTGLKLQNALPDARILYGSATGATTVRGLSYATRLGLWGEDLTPFAEREEFIVRMEQGGVAAMEIVARDLKALGRHQARVLSYAGVEVDPLIHPLTAAQRTIYDRYADAFEIIHNHLDEALKATGIVSYEGTVQNSTARNQALSQFEGAKQRFFGHLLSGMKAPTVIKAIEANLAAERAAVVQIVSTGEAVMERRLAQVPTERWHDLDIDLTPREYVFDFLRHGFPVAQYREHVDDTGDTVAILETDADGNTIECPEAVAKRDALLRTLAEQAGIPTLLDQIMHHFGAEQVAEVTGRRRRTLRVRDEDGRTRISLETRPASAAKADIDAFKSGRKPVIVFSYAGGYGESYHADAAGTHHAKRYHYVPEPGWRANVAIQGFGRSHRTHQVHAPCFRPVTTTVRGERRYIATIARRLDTLGAITRGQSNAQTRMGEAGAIFAPRDNLESQYARAGLKDLYWKIYRKRVPDWSLARLQRMTGLKLLDHEGAMKRAAPPMHTFLNRLLALRIAHQNSLFAALEECIDARIDEAIRSETYSEGMEVITASSIEILERVTLRTDPRSGAKTELVRILRTVLIPPTTLERIMQLRSSYPEHELRRNRDTGEPALLVPYTDEITDKGECIARIKLICPVRVDVRKKLAGHEPWKICSEKRFAKQWAEWLRKAPTYQQSEHWMACGLLLPMWEQLPRQKVRVRKAHTTSGEVLIGRLLHAGTALELRQRAADAASPASAGDVIAILAQSGHGASAHLSNGIRIARQAWMDTKRLLATHLGAGDRAHIERLGGMSELHYNMLYTFIPTEAVLDRVLKRWPLASIERPQGDDGHG